MHCRVFDIRLGTHRDADQATLNAFLDQVDVVSTTATLVHTTTQFWSVLIFYKELPGMKRAERPASATDEQQAASKPERSKPSEQIELDPAQQQVYDKLRQWRSTQAQTEGVPVYVVAPNHALRQSAQHGISSREELLQIERFGPKRTVKYADAILEVLASFQDDV